MTVQIENHDLQEGNCFPELKAHQCLLLSPSMSYWSQKQGKPLNFLICNMLSFLFREESLVAMVKTYIFKAITYSGSFIPRMHVFPLLLADLLCSTTWHTLLLLYINMYSASADVLPFNSTVQTSPYPLTKEGMEQIGLLNY